MHHRKESDRSEYHAMKRKPIKEMYNLGNVNQDEESEDESYIEQENETEDTELTSLASKTAAENSKINPEAKTQTSEINTSFIFSASYLLIKYLFFVVLVFASGISLYVYFVKSENTLDNLFNSLKKKFPDQSEVTWKRVKVAVNNSFSNPLYPSTILLLAAKNAEQNAACLAKQLTAEISTYGGNHDITLSGTELAEALDARYKIYETFQNTKEHQVLLLLDVDKLPVSVITILHGFCDHEYSPYKKLIFIMTASSDEPFSDDGKIFDQVAHRYLTKVWQGLNQDKLPALLSRITGTVGLIKQESNSVC